MEASISIGKSNEKHVPSSQLPKEGLFRLREQPKEKQRKSYSKENRFISPSPLFVVPTNPLTIRQNIVQGNVSTKIVFENGTEIEPQEESAIMDGNRIVPLNADFQAQFQLKLIQTRETKFRLRFCVQGQMIGNRATYQEVFYSLPFGVTTPRKSIKRPSIINLHMKYGYCDRENEIWIKGKNFSERNTMEVEFGGRQAKIIETDDRLLVCLTPIIDMELEKEKQVEVRVRNVCPFRGNMDAERILTYTFLAPPVHSMDKAVVDMMRNGMEQSSWNHDLFCNQFPS